VSNVLLSSCTSSKISWFLNVSYASKISFLPPWLATLKVSKRKTCCCFRYGVIPDATRFSDVEESALGEQISLERSDSSSSILLTWIPLKRWSDRESRCCTLEQRRRRASESVSINLRMSTTDSTVWSSSSWESCPSSIPPSLDPRRFASYRMILIALAIP
jgi:hypothetical protein